MENPNNSATDGQRKAASSGDLKDNVSSIPLPQTGHKTPTPIISTGSSSLQHKPEESNKKTIIIKNIASIPLPSQPPPPPPPQANVTAPPPSQKTTTAQSATASATALNTQSPTVSLTNMDTKVAAQIQKAGESVRVTNVPVVQRQVKVSVTTGASVKAQPQGPTAQSSLGKETESSSKMDTSAQQKKPEGISSSVTASESLNVIAGIQMSQHSEGLSALVSYSSSSSSEPSPSDHHGEEEQEDNKITSALSESVDSSGDKTQTLMEESKLDTASGEVSVPAVPIETVPTPQETTNVIPVQPAKTLPTNPAQSTETTKLFPDDSLQTTDVPPVEPVNTAKVTNIQPAGMAQISNVQQGKMTEDQSPEVAQSVEVEGTKVKVPQSQVVAQVTLPKPMETAQVAKVDNDQPMDSTESTDSQQMEVSQINPQSAKALEVKKVAMTQPPEVSKSSPLQPTCESQKVQDKPITGGSDSVQDIPEVKPKENTDENVDAVAIKVTAAVANSELKLVEEDASPDKPQMDLEQDSVDERNQQSVTVALGDAVEEEHVKKAGNDQDPEQGTLATLSEQQVRPESEPSDVKEVVDEVTSVPGSTQKQKSVDGSPSIEDALSEMGMTLSPRGVLKELEETALKVTSVPESMEVSDEQNDKRQAEEDVTMEVNNEQSGKRKLEEDANESSSESDDLEIQRKRPRVDILADSPPQTPPQSARKEPVREDEEEDEEEEGEEERGGHQREGTKKSRGQSAGTVPGAGEEKLKRKKRKQAVDKNDEESRDDMEEGSREEGQNKENNNDADDQKEKEDGKDDDDTSTPSRRRKKKKKSYERPRGEGGKFMKEKPGKSLLY